MESILPQNPLAKWAQRFAEDGRCIEEDGLCNPLIGPIKSMMRGCYASLMSATVDCLNTGATRLMIDTLLVFGLMLALVGLAMPTIVQLTRILRHKNDTPSRALPAERDVVTLGDCLRVTANG